MANEGVENGGRCCWVCYGTEADAEVDLCRDQSHTDWVQPCSCRGSSQWVHQTCLQKWVDVMQRGNMNRKISCPQCKTEYILVFPSMGIVVSILDAIEEITHKVCPFITGGVLLGSIYWTAITYGAVTVMQVLGHREGLEMLESADPVSLLLFLPAVPAVLICERAIHWEDTLLKAFTSSRRGFQPLPQSQMNNQSEPNAHNLTGIDSTGVSLIVGGSSSPTRVLCSALILPTVSTLIGKLFFSSVRGNLQRAALGGLTFLLLRGAFNMYHKQKLLVRQSSRKILDYTVNNLKLYTNRRVCTDCVNDQDQDAPSPPPPPPDAN